MRFRELVLISLAVCFATSMAQEQPLVNKPPRILRGQTIVRSARVDTRSFVPQVKAQVRAFVERKENNFRPPWRQIRVEPNSIPTGQVLENLKRGNTRELFPGIQMTGWVPPDPELAVGPSNIVSTVNVSIAFYDKTGTNQFQQSLATFFAPTGSGPENDLFDPKCFYDKLAGRFVVVCLEEHDTPQTSKFLVGVSDDSNPNGTWYLYRFEAIANIGGTNYWADYPGAGYNRDAYVFTANLFGFSAGFGGVEFLVVRKSTVLNGGAATTFTFLDGNAFAVQIPEISDNSVDKNYGVSDFNTGFAKVFAITNLLANPPTIVSTFVVVPSFTYPTVNCPSPSGRVLDSMDGRYLNAKFRNGRVFAAHGVQTGGATELKCRWYEFNMNNYPIGVPAVSQSGDVAGPAGDYYFMPAMESNEFNDVSMIFSRSSNSIVADIMQVGRHSGDPPGSMGAPVLLEGSAFGMYGNGGFNRWGDYFDVQIDPNDETTFWGIGMDARPGDGWWRTSIFSWTVTTPVVLSNVTLDSPTVIGGNPVGAHVNLSGNAPLGGYTVGITCSNNLVATVPASVTVPVGASTFAFTVNTNAVADDTPITINGTFRGVQRMGNLNVQWANKYVNPAGMSTIGTLLFGNLASLNDQDGNRLGLRVPANADLAIPIRISLNATLPISSPSRLDFVVVSRTDPADKFQRIKLFDWVTNRFVEQDVRLSTATDLTTIVSITSNISRFIQPGTNIVRAIVEWEEAFSESAELWRSETDRAVWRVFR